MPIYNLVQRKQLIPKLGNIRKGVKEPVIDKNTGKPKIGKGGEIITRPKEVDYFVLKVDEAVPGLKDDVLRVYGEKPKKLVAFLASADVGRAWDYWFEAYNFNQLIARADGNIVTYLFDTETNQKIIVNGQIVEVPKKNTYVTELLDGLGVGDILGYHDGMVISKTKDGEPVFFDAVGRLNVVLQDLYRQAYWTVHTGGLYGDVPHITEMVENINKLAASLDNFAPPMIPFTLTRVETERSYTDEAGKKHRRKGWDIQMEILPDFFKGVMKAFAAAPITLADVTPAPRLQAPADYVEADAYVAENNGVDWEEGGPDWEEEIPSDFDAEFLKEHEGSAAVSREVDVPVMSAKFLVDEGLMPNLKHAEAVIALLQMDGAPIEAGKARFKLYQDWRKKYPRNDAKTRKLCAQKAIAGEVPE